MAQIIPLPRREPEPLEAVMQRMKTEAGALIDYGIKQEDSDRLELGIRIAQTINDFAMDLEQSGIGAC